MHPPLTLHKHPHCKEARGRRGAPAGGSSTLFVSVSDRPASARVRRLPPLKQPRQKIEALTQCHDDNPLTKFVGVCNGQKVALDQCFREEARLPRF